MGINEDNIKRRADEVSAEIRKLTPYSDIWWRRMRLLNDVQNQVLENEAAKQPKAMRNTPCDKEYKAYEKNLKADAISKLAPTARMPDRAALEKDIEKTEKCKTCGSGVRALCDEWEPSKDRSVHDAELTVRLYCRSAKCGWSAVQIRPWSAAKPVEI